MTARELAHAWHIYNQARAARAQRIAERAATAIARADHDPVAIRARARLEEAVACS